MGEAKNKKLMKGTGKTLAAASFETTGIIIPIEWDDKANPIAFALYAYDDKEYLIDRFSDPDTVPQSLLRKKIKAVGRVMPAENKRQKIVILHYDVIEEDYAEVNNGE